MELFLFDLHALLIWGNHIPLGLGAPVLFVGVGLPARTLLGKRVNMGGWETIALGAASCSLTGLTTRLLFGWWAGFVPEVVGAIVLLGLGPRFRLWPQVAPPSSG